MPTLPPDKPTESASADILHIQRAIPEQIEAIYDLLLRCGRHMATQGFRNWDPPPTSVERLRRDVQQETLLVALNESNVLIGSVTLRRQPTHSYDVDVTAGRVVWIAKDGKAMYVSHLATHPDAQSTGIGSALLRAAEFEALRQDVRILRCDVLAANTTLTHWYMKREYRHVGHRVHSGWAFQVFEKRL